MIKAWQLNNPEDRKIFKDPPAEQKLWIKSSMICISSILCAVKTILCLSYASQQMCLHPNLIILSLKGESAFLVSSCYVCWAAVSQRCQFRFPLFKLYLQSHHLFNYYTVCKYLSRPDKSLCVVHTSLFQVGKYTKPRQSPRFLQWKQKRY